MTFFIAADSGLKNNAWRDLNPATLGEMPDSRFSRQILYFQDESNETCDTLFKYLFWKPKGFKKKSHPKSAPPKRNETLVRLEGSCPSEVEQRHNRSKRNFPTMKFRQKKLNVKVFTKKFRHPCTNKEIIFWDQFSTTFEIFFGTIKFWKKCKSGGFRQTRHPCGKQHFWKST